MHILYNRRDCCRKRERILLHIGKFAATKGENLWGQWGNIQLNNTRGYCIKREQMLRQMGKFVETKREDFCEQQG